MRPRLLWGVCQLLGRHGPRQPLRLHPLPARRLQRHPLRRRRQTYATLLWCCMAICMAIVLMPRTIFTCTDVLPPYAAIDGVVTLFAAALSHCCFAGVAGEEAEARFVALKAADYRGRQYHMPPPPFAKWGQRARGRQLISAKTGERTGSGVCVCVYVCVCVCVCVQSSLTRQRRENVSRCPPCHATAAELDRVALAIRCPVPRWPQLGRVLNRLPNRVLSVCCCCCCPCGV